MLLGLLEQQKPIRDLLSHSSGGRKSKIKVSPGLVSFEGCEEEYVPCLSPSFWWLSAKFGVLQIVDTSLNLCSIFMRLSLIGS